MSRHTEQGFTIIEIMLAMVILTVGVMALVSGSAMTSRMIGWGNKSTQVVQVATARAELIRQTAASTSPGCTAASLTSGTAVTSGVTETWTIGGAAGDETRPVTMRFQYRGPRGTRTDTVAFTLYCP